MSETRMTRSRNVSISKSSKRKILTENTDENSLNVRPTRAAKSRKTYAEKTEAERVAEEVINSVVNDSSLFVDPSIENTIKNEPSFQLPDQNQNLDPLDANLLSGTLANHPDGVTVEHQPIIYNPNENYMSANGQDLAYEIPVNDLPYSSRPSNDVPKAYLNAKSEKMNSNPSSIHSGTVSPSNSNPDPSGVTQAYLKKGKKGKHGQTLPNHEFHCPICNKQLQCQSRVLEHVAAVHEEQRIYDCVFCDQTYKYKSNLRAHIKKKHSNEKPICPVCPNKQFPNFDTMLKHIMFIHQNVSQAPMMIKKYETKEEQQKKLKEIVSKPEIGIRHDSALGVGVKKDGTREPVTVGKIKEAYYKRQKGSAYTNQRRIWKKSKEIIETEQHTIKRKKEILATHASRSENYGSHQSINNPEYSQPTAPEFAPKKRTGFKSVKPLEPESEIQATPEFATPSLPNGLHSQVKLEQAITENFPIANSSSKKVGKKSVKSSSNPSSPISFNAKEFLQKSGAYEPSGKKQVSKKSVYKPGEEPAGISPLAKSSESFPNPSSRKSIAFKTLKPKNAPPEPVKKNLGFRTGSSDLNDLGYSHVLGVIRKYGPDTKQIAKKSVRRKIINLDLPENNQLPPSPAQPLPDIDEVMNVTNLETASNFNYSDMAMSESQFSNNSPRNRIPSMSSLVNHQNSAFESISDSNSNAGFSSHHPHTPLTPHAPHENLAHAAGMLPVATILTSNQNHQEPGQGDIESLVSTHISKNNELEMTESNSQNNNNQIYDMMSCKLEPNQME